MSERQTTSRVSGQDIVWRCPSAHVAHHRILLLLHVFSNAGNTVYGVREREREREIETCQIILFRFLASLVMEASSTLTVNFSSSLR